MKNKKKFLSILSCICCICVFLGIAGVCLPVRAEGASNVSVAPQSLWSEVDSNLATIEQNVQSPDFVQIGWFNKYKEYTADNLCPVPEYVKNGVKVTVPAGNIVLKYKNVIDLNALDNSKPLLDWMPVAEERGTASMLRFTVRLEDVADENNYLEIIFYQLYYRMRWSLDFPGREAKQEQIWTVGDFANTPTWHFDALHSIISPYSLRYDKSTDTFSMYQYSEGAEVLNSSLSPSSVALYDTKTFKGFTDNLVTMTVTANAITEETSYYLYNVAGQGMNGETIADTQAPSFHIERPTDVPKAYVGKPYRLFDAKVFDVIDGELDHQIRLFEPGKYKVNYTDADYTLITDGAFVPTKVGKYSIVYYAKDAAGNETENLINVQSAHEWEKLDVVVDSFVGTVNGTDNVFAVGNQIAVPKYTVVGGSGAYTTSVKAYSLLDNEEIAVENGYASVNKAGNYKFTITAVDYCGNSVVKSVYFDIQSSRLPIVRDTLNMFKAFYDGSPVELPTIYAYDYNSYPGIAVSADLKVVAVGANNVKKEVFDSASGDDRIAFLPQKSVYGDSVTVQYVYKCRKGDYNVAEDCLVKEYNVPIYDSPKYLKDYFYAQSGVEIGGNTAQEYKQVQRYVSFRSSDGVANSFGFVNPIAADSAYVEMSFPAKGQNFSGFTIRFSDAKNADIGFEVSIYKIAGTYTNKSLLKYGGRDYKIIGGFDLESGNYGSEGKSPIAISYKNGKLYDYGGLAVCEISTGFNGEAFNGFPSGAVRMEFSFNKVQEGAQVNLSKIADQNLYLKYKNDKLETFEDQIKPIINVETSTSEHQLGETVIVPFAHAYDTITSGKINANGDAEVIDVMVEVRSPKNDVVLEKQALVEGLTFVLETYGEYRIVYTASDNKNFTATQALAVGAKDETAPILTLNGSDVLTGRVNVEMYLTSVVALDNVTPYAYIELSCTVVKPNGQIVDVARVETEEAGYSVWFSYTPDQAGRYTIVYLASDEAGNMAMKVLTLVVSEV